MKAYTTKTIYIIFIFMLIIIVFNMQKPKDLMDYKICIYQVFYDNTKLINLHV